MKLLTVLMVTTLSCSAAVAIGPPPITLGDSNHYANKIFKNYGSMITHTNTSHIFRNSRDMRNTMNNIRYREAVEIEYYMGHHDTIDSIYLIKVISFSDHHDFSKYKTNYRKYIIDFIFNVCQGSTRSESITIDDDSRFAWSVIADGLAITHDKVEYIISCKNNDDNFIEVTFDPYDHTIAVVESTVD